ncbi:cytochrome P450 26B1-like [Ylistrum balloti]|uniref:cytochrome P450 26B1-like n=1 Tax=Ylistrum balloti TaxID=509963 RepID=UPI002905DEAF|nr:cytochrome P450 26B1-like [Ylistrum balloti]
MTLHTIPYKKRDVDKSASLPPGSLGWPIVGETFKLAAQKVNFFREKRRMYGRIFKTHLFGSPVIRVTGNKNVREILQGENKNVKSSYPTSIRTLLGPNALSMSEGVLHKSRKVQLMQYLSPEFLRQHRTRFVNLIDDHMLRWCSEPSVDIYLGIRALFTEMAAKFLVDIDIPMETNHRIKELYQQFTDNMFSIPINLPGFGLYKGLQAKRELKKIFAAIVNKNGRSVGEFPSVLQAYGADLAEHADPDVDKLLDAIIELMWNASETVSSGAFAIVYHLTQNPSVFQKVRDDIESQDKCNHSGPSYLDYVVKEALRTTPPVGGAYRKVIKPIVMEGYTFPKDWTVICGFRDTHENDVTQVDPGEFNPDRWIRPFDGDERASFLTFGGGLRICPGKNYATVVLKHFTRRLCDRFVWKFLTKDPELVLFPAPKPKHTLQACFFDRLSKSC